jgi:hypothetical protein
VFFLTNVEQALEGDGMDEVWLPVDHTSVGLLTDNELQKKLIKKVPNGVRLTAVVDSCNSGSGYFRVSPILLLFPFLCSAF